MLRGHPLWPNLAANSLLRNFSVTGQIFGYLSSRRHTKVKLPVSHLQGIGLIDVTPTLLMMLYEPNLKVWLHGPVFCFYVFMSFHFSVFQFLVAQFFSFLTFCFGCQLFNFRTYIYRYQSSTFTPTLDTQKSSIFQMLMIYSFKNLSSISMGKLLFWYLFS